MITGINIQPKDGENPSAYADRVGQNYANSTPADSKKKKGQYFTPLSISMFMSTLANTPSEELSILDPGCGCGILSSCLIEHLALNYHIKRIQLTTYETDDDIIPYTKSVFLYLQVWLSQLNIAFEFEILTDDFVLAHSECLSHTPTLFREDMISEYDYIISNPPYFKLSKDDIRVKSSISIVDGQTNIYALFLAISCKMLKESGQMIFITPRSFSSGRYFRLFRKFFFSNVTIDFIHLFNTRNSTFAKDDVLQELLIMSCHPNNSNQNQNIKVSFSESSKDLDKSYVKAFPGKDIIDNNSSERILYLPVCSNDESVLNLFKSWDGTLAKYNIQISTGPVVAYRQEEFLTKEEETNTVPLFWSHNVSKMLCDQSAEKKNRCQYIKLGQESISYLIPNKNYIFLRRFSAKDDKSRLIAAPYFGNTSQYRFIGVENKLNYIYRPQGHLNRSEIMGISALLNSELYDTYFRLFNGNINVSSTELRIMPFPPIQTIREIGNKIILTNTFSLEYINNIIQEYFSIQLS